MGTSQTAPHIGPTTGEGIQHVTYVSNYLESTLPVLVVLEMPDEPIDYQLGVVLGEIVLREVWAGGTNFGPFIDDTTARILAYEAVGVLEARKRHEFVRALKLEPPRIELTAEQCKTVDDTAGIAA